MSSSITRDFNNDGRADLALASYGSNTISILLGNGDGTFQGEATFPANRAPESLVASDFNGDGRLDLAVINYTDPGTVSVLLGNGDGTFQPVLSTSVTPYPGAMGAGVFDQDGKPDLVVANLGCCGTSGNTALVLLGKGDGTFSTGVTLAVGIMPSHILVADLNGDNKLDVVTANAGSNNVSLLLGNGDATFQSALNYNTGPYSRFEAQGDVLRLYDGESPLLTFRTGAAEEKEDAIMGAATVTGTVTYRQRVALTPEAVIEVKLSDVSRSDAPAVTIAEQVIRPAGRQVPIGSTLRYDPHRINEGGRYAVQARILEGGKLRFVSTGSYPVITGGNPQEVEVVVNPVR